MTRELADVEMQAVRALAAQLGPVRREIDSMLRRRPRRALALPQDAQDQLEALVMAAEGLQQCLSRHMGVDPLALQQRQERLELERQQARERAALEATLARCADCGSAEERLFRSGDVLRCAGCLRTAEGR